MQKNFWKPKSSGYHLPVSTLKMLENVRSVRRKNDNISATHISSENDFMPKQ